MEDKILAALQQTNVKLDCHSEKFDLINEQFKEHPGILPTLRSSTEFTSAEISEFRLQNAKHFGEIKRQSKEIELA
ncbi:hypothetical protein ACOI1C_06815 [Bacillus sp. DJP31]|uniref:hypothetical protein n=1 Tax=Bacillus sp. DJP31 TaxID=3409789 RepID=UPI003BB6E87E